MGRETEMHQSVTISVRTEERTPEFKHVVPVLQWYRRSCGCAHAGAHKRTHFFLVWLFKDKTIDGNRYCVSLLILSGSIYLSVMMMTYFHFYVTLLKPLWGNDSPKFTDEAQRGQALEVSQLQGSKARAGTPTSWSNICVLSPLIYCLP